MRRFFIPSFPSPPEVGMVAHITDRVLCHHLCTVMRVRQGDAFILIAQDSGCLWEVTLKTVDKQYLTIEWVKSLSPRPLTKPAITLLASVIKEQRWDWLLQKATELGVDGIFPFQAERSVVISGKKERLLSESKRVRWMQILQQATEQSEGDRLPVLGDWVTMDTLEQQFTGINFFKVFLAERCLGQDGTALRELLSPLAKAPPDRIILAVGPEGGWTDTEREAFLVHGFHPASMGARILRAETAAIAAIAAIRYQFQ